MKNTSVVAVRLFAQAREVARSSTVNLDVPSTCTVADLRRSLADTYPALAALLRRSAVAVNRTYADDQAPISAGDEIAIIPPVAGG